MISKKQKVFVESYMTSFNATTAALAAGYSENTARQQGSRLLSYGDIKKEISERCIEITGKTQDKIAYLIGYWQSVIDDQSANPKDRLKASELMAKYLDMFNSKIELTGKDGEPIKVIWSE